MLREPAPPVVAVVLAWQARAQEAATPTVAGSGWLTGSLVASALAPSPHLAGENDGQVLLLWVVHLQATLQTRHSILRPKEGVGVGGVSICLCMGNRPCWRNSLHRPAWINCSAKWGLLLYGGCVVWL